MLEGDETRKLHINLETRAEIAEYIEVVPGTAQYGSRHSLADLGYFVGTVEPGALVEPPGPGLVPSAEL